MLEEKQDRDATESNLGLAVFKHAMDWRVELTVLEVFRAAVELRRFPKPFRLEITRSGRGLFVQHYRTGGVRFVAWDEISGARGDTWLLRKQRRLCQCKRAHRRA